MDALIKTNNIKRNMTVDIAKGIGIIFVIIGHMNYLFSYKSFVMTFIYSFHMPLFIFLSSYVFNFHENISIKSYCYKRFCQIIKPYFAFALISYSVNCIRTQSWSINELYGILMGIGSNGNLNFNIALWFLPMQFICNILFFFILKMTKKIKKKSFSFVLFITVEIIVSIIGYLLIMKQKRLMWGIETAFFSQLFMLLGYMFKILNTKFHDNKRYIYGGIMMSPFAFLLWWFGMNWNGRVDMNAGLYGNIIVFIITALCGIYLVWQLSYILSKIPFVNYILSYIGKSSLFIMGYHLPAFYFMIGPILSYMPNEFATYIWYPNVIGIAYLVTGMIIICIFMKLLYISGEKV